MKKNSQIFMKLSASSFKGTCKEWRWTTHGREECHIYCSLAPLPCPTWMDITQFNDIICHIKKVWKNALVQAVSWNSTFKSFSIVSWQEVLKIPRHLMAYIHCLTTTYVSEHESMVDVSHRRPATIWNLELIFTLQFNLISPYFIEALKTFKVGLNIFQKYF
jgi:hypothetical protein